MHDRLRRRTASHTKVRRKDFGRTVNSANSRFTTFYSLDTLVVQGLKLRRSVAEDVPVCTARLDLLFRHLIVQTNSKKDLILYLLVRKLELYLHTLSG